LDFIRTYERLQAVTAKGPIAREGPNNIDTWQCSRLLVYFCFFSLSLSLSLSLTLSPSLEFNNQAS
jgi:hypothetical protein